MDFTTLKPLFDFGVVGIVAAVLLWQTNRDKVKLFEIIEKNTKAFEELRNVIDKCQLTHKHD